METEVERLTTVCKHKADWEELQRLQTQADNTVATCCNLQKSLDKTNEELEQHQKEMQEEFLNVKNIIEYNKTEGVKENQSI